MPPIQIVDALESVGASDPRFTAARVHGTTVMIYRVASSAGAVDAWVAEYNQIADAHGVTLVFEPALLTKMQFASLDAMVEGSTADFAAEGVKVSMWGPEEGYQGPYVVRYLPGSNAPSSVLVEQFQIHGEGTVLFLEGGVDPLASQS